MANLIQNHIHNFKGGQFLNSETLVYIKAVIHLDIQ